jgi:superfamily II DNA helicase RecQ
LPSGSGVTLDYSKLKSKQKEIIQNVLERKDSMAVLPTGFGNNMRYVLSPFHFGQGKIIYANRRNDRV